MRYEGSEKSLTPLPYRASEKSLTPLPYRASEKSLTPVIREYLTTEMQQQRPSLATAALVFNLKKS